jgi:hypothetical protein
MKKLVCTLFLLLYAGLASAEQVEWHGTLDVDLGAQDLGNIYLVGSGVATINPLSGGVEHLTSVRFEGGITGSTAIPVTDPDTTPTLKGIFLSVTLGTGTLTGIYPTPPWPLRWPAGSTLPLRGHTRFCLFVPSCISHVDYNLTKRNGATGVGVGGETITMGGVGSLRVSIEVAPWTIDSTKVSTDTPEGRWVRNAKGFIHGPFSFASTAHRTSGVVKLVTATKIQSLSSEYPALGIIEMTIKFVPEPSKGILLAFGVGGLFFMGRVRRRRK